MILFFLVFKKDIYQIKIELKTRDLSAKYIDENISNPLKKELLNISEIKDIVSFSHSFGLDLYIKTKTKEKTLTEIEQKINSFSYKNPDIKEIKINKNYDLKYDYFFIVYDDDYFKLKNKADEICSRLLEMRVFKDIKILGEQQIVNNIYFKYENLINYNLDLRDIKNLIKNNNIDSDELNFGFKLGFNGKIKTIEDLKNIEILFKNANFSQKLSEIFEIKKEIKSLTQGQIFYNDKQAIVFAISKKNYFLNYFKLNSLKKRYSAIFEPINKQKKIEIFLDENNILKTIEFYKNLKTKSLCFLGLNPPNNDKFDYARQNRIIIYCDRNEYLNLRKYLLKNNIFFLDKSSIFYFAAENYGELKDKIKKYQQYFNLGTTKTLKPNYDFNYNNLAKFGFLKEDILNSIFSYKKELVLDEYKTEGDDIEIVLKNAENSNFIYSKKYKNLFDINLFLKTDLVEDFEVIAKKNFKYFAILKIKNPSIFRRVKHEFRYLLSL